MESRSSFARVLHARSFSTDLVEFGHFSRLRTRSVSASPYVLAPTAPSIPISTFVATLTRPAEKLTRLLDNMTEYQIADLRDQACKLRFHAMPGLDLKAVRSGPAMVSADDGLLHITMPFTTHAKLASKGLLSFLNGQAEGRGMVSAHADLNISPDMQLHAKTGGTVDLDDGHLRLGPIVTNVTSLWNHNQAALSQPLWRSLDRQIGRLPLNATIAKFWTAAFKPIRVGKSPVAWLVLRPKQLIVSQPLVRGGAVTFSMGLAAEAHVAVQETPPANPPTPLPPADTNESPSNDFLPLPCLCCFPMTMQQGSPWPLLQRGRQTLRG